MKGFNFRPYILALIIIAPVVGLFSVSFIENKSWQAVYVLVGMPLVVVAVGIAFYLLASSNECPNCNRPIQYHSYWINPPSYPKKCPHCGHEFKET
jgi:hypothetical protein